MKKIFVALLILFLLCFLVGCASALFNAAEKGDVKTIKVLLDQGADVNEKYLGDWTPLMVASWYGNIEAVKILLDKGADVNVNSGNGGWTALSCAAKDSHVDIVKLLLDRGADINKAIRLIRNNRGDEKVIKEVIEVLDEIKEQKIAKDTPKYKSAPSTLPTALPLPTEPVAPF